MRIETTILRRAIKYWLVLIISVLVAAPALAHAKPKKKANKGEVSLVVQVGKKAKGFTKKQRKQIRKIADHLKAQPELGQFQVVGHTDSRGKPAMNEKLSLQRAKGVMKLLIKFGVKAERLTAVGKGGAEPRNPKKGKKARRQNQRVELVAQAAPATSEEAVAKVDEAKPEVETPEEPAVEAKTEPAVAAADTAKDVGAPTAAATPVESKAEPKVEAVATKEPAPAQAELPKPAATPKAKPAPKAKAPAKAKPAVEKKVAATAPVEPPPVEIVNEASPIDASVWIAAGATGVATGLALVLGGAASAKAAVLDDLFTGTAEYNDVRDTASQFALGADISRGLSAIGLATTLWFIFDGESDASDESASVGAAITPSGATVFFTLPLGGSVQ